MLDLAQIEAGRMALWSQPVETDEYLRAAVGALRPLAVAKGIASEVDAPVDLPVVSLDPGLLDRVVTNLVGNAVKFTERGKVWVRARHDGEQLSSVAGGGDPHKRADVRRRLGQAGGLRGGLIKRPGRARRR